MVTRRFSSAIAIALLAIGVAHAQERTNRLTAKESAEGWKLLFDGKSLDGWEQHTGGDWSAANGALVCPGTSAGWLATDSIFSNYILKLEFRGAATVNSGVFLRSQKEGLPHITGYELQIWDYQPKGYNTGSLVGAAKAAGTKILPDAWNRYTITADGDHYAIVLNGKTLLDTHDSKHLSGVIGFQCQKNNRIEFRNVRIKTINH
ncbi:MAG: 3-keto-disaccharide hydrolase [Bryobacteraceae bacterium]